MPARSMVNCDFPSIAVPTEAPNDSVVLAKENVLFLVQLFLCGAVARYGFTCINTKCSFTGRSAAFCLHWWNAPKHRSKSTVLHTWVVSRAEGWLCTAGLKIRWFLTEALLFSLWCCVYSEEAVVNLKYARLFCFLYFVHSKKYFFHSLQFLGEERTAHSPSCMSFFT